MMSQTEKDKEEEEYSQEKSTKKHALEVNIDRAVGKPYVIYEGNFLDTVLLNQLDGDSSGPVIVMVNHSARKPGQGVSHPGFASTRVFQPHHLPQFLSPHGSPAGGEPGGHTTSTFSPTEQEEMNA
jgi:hypothetical protein